MAEITKETFKGMSVDSKLEVLFDYMTDMLENEPVRVKARDVQCLLKAESCNKRFKKVEDSVIKNKVFNTAASFAGGFIGGWSAVWASFKFSIFS